MTSPSSHFLQVCFHFFLQMCSPLSSAGLHGHCRKVLKLVFCYYWPSCRVENVILLPISAREMMSLVGSRREQQDRSRSWRKAWHLLWECLLGLVVISTQLSPVQHGLIDSSSLIEFTKHAQHPTSPPKLVQFCSIKQLITAQTSSQTSLI